MKPFTELKPGYSIEKRLSKSIALSVAAVLAVFGISLYCVAHLLMDRKQAAELSKKIDFCVATVEDAAAKGGLNQIVQTAEAMATRRPGTRLELFHSDGRAIYKDPVSAEFKLSDEVRSDAFSVDLSRYQLGVINGTFAIDVEQDRNLMDDFFWAVVGAPLVGGLFTGLFTAWRVRRELRPLHALANQTKRISPQHLDARLALPVLSEELAPWVNQFNALMDRLQKAIEQLEAFNADVAHELRTPLAALMGNTEVALAKERPASELKESMIVSLEQLRQLSSMVNDMLFLSGADRGALARRGEPTRICAIAKSVVEFHEYALEEAGLTAEVHGTAVAAVDAPLLQRALSNLIGNATRFGERGTAVRVLIEEATPSEIQLIVENRGEAIDAATLPRLFDRFFRVDCARCDSESHHGLGLAIVSAIARMHGGKPLASSENGVTRIGLTLHTQASA
jgi:two-component system heavy metal sensor histidine kinase CusS